MPPPAVTKAIGGCCTGSRLPIERRSSTNVPVLRTSSPGNGRKPDGEPSYTSLELTMKSISICVLSLNLLALPAAFAADPWEPGGPLETCLEAALKERPGIVTGWQQSGGGEMTPYTVSVLSQDGSNAEAFCNPASPTGF